MLNQCTLTGNLGDDPEVFCSSEGNPVASLNIAFRSGEQKTGWIKVVCFQRLAEVAQKYLHKGARIAVIGALDQHKWETDEGVQRSSFQLLANTLEFIKTDGRGFKEGYGPDTQVQYHLDAEFMLVSILDGNQAFSVNGERMTPGISTSNSEVGLASLSIAAFVLRLICTSGMISKTEVSASYWHVSLKILNEFPKVLDNVSLELGKQKDRFRISIESNVDNPLGTIESFNKQFQLGEKEREAVEWGWNQEMGNTMFNLVGAYTRAAEFPELPAEASYRLQKVGGAILGMVK